MTASASAGIARHAKGGLAIQPIAATKLIPPRAAQRLIPRALLQARLLDARRKRCIAIRGPAGSGKTTALVSLRQGLLALDFDVAWLSISAEDNNVPRFFDCLLASLAEIAATVAREADPLIGIEGDLSAIEHRVITLVQSIGAHPRELVLMFDDLHKVSEPSVCRSLQWMLEYAPRNLHLVFASRNALPVSIGPLRTSDLVAEFNFSDLQFTMEETELYLREQLDEIDRRDAQVIHRLTGGWVAGLRLFVLNLKTSKRSAYPLVLLRDASTFSGYFEREILARLSPDDLDLLTRLAVCNRFCAQLCAALVGQPNAVAGMTVRLSRLEGDNLFINRINTREGETWYRLHALLREVLLHRVATLPREEQLGLHAAAWHWFEGNGHIDEAVRHAVQAGEPDAAAVLVESRVDGFLARGEVSQMARLVRKLPFEQVKACVGLRIALAHVQLYSADVAGLSDSIAGLERETRLGSIVLNSRHRLHLTHLRAGLALRHDAPEGLQALLPKLRGLPGDADDFLIAGRNNFLGWLHMYRGEFDQARRVLEATVSEQTTPMRGLIGRCISGLNQLQQGQVGEAERIIYEVLGEAERQGPSAVGAANMAACLLADVLYERNDPEAACSLLENRIDIIESVSIPDAVLRALRSLAVSHRLAGRHLEANAYLERLEEYSARHGLDRLDAYAQNLRVHWHLRDATIDRAAGALDRLEAIQRRHAGADNGAGVEIGLCVARARVAMSLYLKAFQRAIRELQPLVELATKSGRAKHEVGLRIQMSVAHQKCGNLHRARNEVRAALRLGRRLSLIRTVLDTSRHVPRILRELLDDSSTEAVDAFYIRRLLSASGAAYESRSGESTEIASGGLGELSVREIDVLNLLSQTMANKRIAQVLNVSPDTVKWHLKNIYAKLGVAKRDAAVAKLRDAQGRKAFQQR